MKIGFCTWFNINDKNAWSGTQYPMLKALEKYCGEIIPLVPEHNKFFILGKILNKLTKIFLGQRFHYFHASFVTKEFAKSIHKQINKTKPDILFAISHGVLLNDVNCDIPIIYYSDVTSKLLVNYYSDFSNLLPIAEKWYHQVDQNIMDKADIVIFSSDWAAKSAINDYDCDKEKIYVIPLGANIENIPERSEILNRRNKDKTILKLLFSGSDWERKGGDIAVETMEELNRRGIPTELTLLTGIALPHHKKNPRINIVGHLNKENSEQAIRMHNIFMDASIFILPTRKDCSPTVLCEAAAYGLPAVSTNVAGVSAHIENKVTGYLLPLEAGFKDYAKTIEKIWSDKNTYVNLCKNARDKFEHELNWDSWGIKIRNLIDRHRLFK
jgi:glycosyltransferase involved in cell wall biosynthesis